MTDPRPEPPPHEGNVVPLRRPEDPRLRALWEDFRAAVLVRERVRTPEVLAEVERARIAFEQAFCPGISG